VRTRAIAVRAAAAAAAGAAELATLRATSDAVARAAADLEVSRDLSI